MVCFQGQLSLQGARTGPGALRSARPAASVLPTSPKRPGPPCRPPRARQSGMTARLGPAPGPRLPPPLPGHAAQTGKEEEAEEDAERRGKGALWGARGSAIVREKERRGDRPSKEQGAGMRGRGPGHTREDATPPPTGRPSPRPRATQAPPGVPAARGGSRRRHVPATWLGQALHRVCEMGERAQRGDHGDPGDPGDRGGG